MLYILLWGFSAGKANNTFITDMVDHDMSLWPVNGINRTFGKLLHRNRTFGSICQFFTAHPVIAQPHVDI